MKPANVLLAPDGSAKLADFGIACAVADEDEPKVARVGPPAPSHKLVGLTVTGVRLLGTLAHMTPERLAGRPATGHGQGPHDRFASASEMSDALGV